MRTITVALSDEAYDALEASSYAEAFSRTDVINRAIQAYAGISAARPGQVVEFEDARGVYRRLLVIGP